MEFLFLKVNGTFLLERFLEMELNDRVQCLESGFS